MRRDVKAPDDLLAAYLDGVAELSPDERRAIDARLAEDPGLVAEAAETRALLGQLRALPPTAGAGEPDWAALERSIRDACGPEVPRPWWRRLTWRWVVPGVALAAAAAGAALLLRSPATATGPTEPAPTDGSAVAAKRGPDAAGPPAELGAAGDTLALWLDGEDIEIGLDAEALLEVPWEGGPTAGDLLPADDLAWIDELDDAALDRAEAWLKQPAELSPVGRKRS